MKEIDGFENSDSIPKVVLMFDELSMDMLGDATEEDIFGEETPTEETNDNADEQVNPDELFGEGAQEIVGEENDDNSQEKEELDDSDELGSSPKKSQFYSSALKALKDDGVLPDLDDEFITAVKTPEDFAEAIEKQVAARLGESERRIKEALDNNAPVDKIAQFTNAINYLDSIEETTLESEDENGETLRRQIIYQDYINKGFKPERAEKEVNKAFNAGTDIEDAKAALESNKEHFREQYDDLIEEKKKETLRIKKEREEQTKKFQKKVLDTETVYDIKLDKQSRQKIYDNAVKPVHKDSNGRLLTTIQKYSQDNPMDAEYYFSLFYTMTDGFKSIDKFIDKKATVAKKGALRDLERKISNIPTSGDGSVDFSFGKDDSNSFLKGYKIDI